MDETDACYLSATQLVDLFQWKTLSPVEVTKGVLGRISAMNGPVNAFCQVDEDAAMAQARESEARWMKGEPLGLVDGVPVSIKDLLLTEGSVTGRGSKATIGAAPETTDAPAVARMRQQGAVFVGRTATPELGWKGITDSPLTGITRNPWNTDKTPGGSSGGAAVAAALGMGALHIGTDGGGSVRIPAGFTGVFALKPTAGRVPVHPASAFGSLSHVGPITRTVEDAALMMNVMSQPDPRDWLALPFDPWDFRTGLDLGVRHLRVAYSPALGFADVDPEIAEIVAGAVQVFGELGASVELQDPGFDDPIDCFNKHWFWGCHKMISAFPEAARADMDPGMVEVAEIGANYSLDDYSRAVDERVVLGTMMNEFHAEYDLLVTPALAVPPFDAGRDVPEPGPGRRWTDWTPFTYPFNLTGQPACVVPCGFTGNGLPVALQIVGPRYGDALVLRAATAFEQLHPFEMPRDVAS
ncbi:MAG: amidase [Rhodospirillaceae bacterium]|jgi:aspartyl-tRNA(Asn)/glutamyl-tRNA(Gln) amidotransferase subunit A|nr:amidase [Rhodospirillaceae bacterium]